MTWEKPGEDDPEEKPLVEIELSEGELTRVKISVLIEEAYRQNLDNPDKKIAGIEKLLDKFEGKYEKLLEAVYKKYPIRNSEELVSISNNSLREILEVIEKDNINPAKWMELAEYYDKLGMSGRSEECRNYAISLQE